MKQDKTDKEIIVESFDEEKCAVRVTLTEAIEHELKLYRTLLTCVLKAEKCYGKVEQYRRWRTSKDNDVIVRLIIEKNERTD